MFLFPPPPLREYEEILGPPSNKGIIIGIYQCLYSYSIAPTYSCGRSTFGQALTGRYVPYYYSLVIKLASLFKEMQRDWGCRSIFSCTQTNNVLASIFNTIKSSPFRLKSAKNKEVFTNPLKKQTNILVLLFVGLLRTWLLLCLNMC